MVAENEVAENDPKKIALQRGSEIQREPAETLIIEPWSSVIKFVRHSIWNVRYPKLEPPIMRRIAVDKAGYSLWLNNPSDTSELSRFFYAENLIARLKDKPDLLAETLLALCCDSIKLLRSLDDIEGMEFMEFDEKKQVAQLQKQFSPPQLDASKQTTCLDFWSWSRRGGNLERWHVRFERKMVVKRQLFMKYLGLFLPYL